MARIRTIKPEFWVDDQIVELDYATRLLFIGLWNFVDDEGYVEYKAKRIKMQIFPADSLDVSGMLTNLLEMGRLARFTSDQGDLLRVVNWDRHQKISHPSPTRFTGIQAGGSVNAPESSGAFLISPDGSGLKGKEGKGKEGKGTDLEPLSPDESDDGTLLPESWHLNQGHRDKATSLHLDADREAARFRDHANRTQRRLKNWNAGFTNWLKQQAVYAQQRQGRPSPATNSRGSQRDAELVAFMTGADNNYTQEIER